MFNFFKKKKQDSKQIQNEENSLKITRIVNTDISSNELKKDTEVINASLIQQKKNESKKDYINPIQKVKHTHKVEDGTSIISGRKFQEFNPNDTMYPVDRNFHYRSDILQTMPQYIADETYDDSVKNDQPTLISKRRSINEFGYIDTLNEEQQKSKALDPLISVKDFSMIFKDKKQKKYAVNNISFDINPNENIAFIGANGAGKTTTVEAIAGINKPTEGTISYNFKYKRSFQEGLGIQFQDSSYPRGITVKNVIDFMKDAYGIDESKMSDVEFDNLLEVFKIKEFYTKEAIKLSGGQQQRLNVLLSLMHKPKVLFLDELVTGLDIQIRNQLENFVQDFTKQNKITVVLVSHDMLEVEKMTQRVVLLQNGIIKVDMYLDEIHYQYGSVDKLVSRYI